MLGTFEMSCVEQISEFALRALLYEVSASPKPGLVDRFGSGAHSDMDFYTFMNSAAALSTYFRNCALEGMKPSNETAALMQHLRPLGIEAESRMYRATEGVNTHKGLIYAMGILTAAGAKVISQRGAAEKLHSFELERLGEVVTEMVLPELSHEIKCLEESHTYGGEQYKSLGILGARGEALGGYEKARNVGVHRLNQAMEAYGLALNEALLYTLLNLCLVVEDSNVIGRHDVSMLRQSQEKIKDILSKGHFLTAEGREAYKVYCEWCKEHRISHGGAADMLAVTHFMRDYSNWVTGILTKD